MTSNVGAATAASKKRGIDLAGNGKSLEELKNTVSKAALTAAFSPEFRNKITATINFSSLGENEIRKVTDKFLDLAKNKLKDRKGINLSFTEDVYKYIAKNGFDPLFGARPVKKLIDTKIVDVLVRPILKGLISKGDDLIFSIDSLGEVVYAKRELETVEA